MAIRQESMTPTEVTRLFEELRVGEDPRLRERLVLEHRWLAEQCARRFRNRGESDADLVQVASIGLLKAVDRYDPGRGIPFHGYAIPTIIGELKRHFRDSTWGIHVPRRSKDLLSHLNAATQLLHQRLGRSPTPPEVAAEIGVDVESVVDALDARQANRPRMLPTDDVGGPDQLVSTDRDLDAIEMRVETLAAMHGLDERSRTILLWRFYEECTQREIGERLGIGQVQVSRLLRTLLDELRGELADPGRPPLSQPHSTLSE